MNKINKDFLIICIFTFSRGKSLRSSMNADLSINAIVATESVFSFGVIFSYWPVTNKWRFMASPFLNYLNYMIFFWIQIENIKN